MHQTQSHQANKEQDKANKMAKLMENDLFRELFMEDYIERGILEQALHMGMDNKTTLDNIKARQSLHQYIFNTLSSQLCYNFNVTY